VNALRLQSAQMRQPLAIQLSPRFHSQGRH
jgi:hypothetical protein